MTDPNIFQLKLRIARHQLGTALHLFLYDFDPISVQCLACGGSEMIDEISQLKGADGFRSHVFATIPDMDIQRYKKLRNQYWNSFKHLTTKQNKLRDHYELIQRFSDHQNDSALFCGWYDYSSFTNTMPIEAQVFQCWFFAINEQTLSPEADPSPFRDLFPGITGCDRKEQKRRLRRAAEKYKNRRELREDRRTEISLLQRW